MRIGVPRKRFAMPDLMSGCATADEALAFIRKHGVVLASAKGIAPASATDSVWRNLFNTYKRIDAEGSFHTRWSQDGEEVPI